MGTRLQRQLEELLKVSGNETCADCHAVAPRWASVNLGVFLCVACASVHRKMGTHTSRVKSVTLDEWTREQIASVRAVGNAASNAVYNPNEALHPPPTTTGADERDSELERYIRRKYEQGAFKPGAGAAARHAPTSLNRARLTHGSWAPREVDRDPDRTPAPTPNRRNPELNDLLVPRPRSGERELPPLPPAGLAPPRPRPARASSADPSTAVWSGTTARAAPAPPAVPAVPALVDVADSASSTRPLQLAPQWQSSSSASSALASTSGSGSGAGTGAGSAAPGLANPWATLLPPHALGTSPGALSVHSAPPPSSSPYQAAAFGTSPYAPAPAGGGGSGGAGGHPPQLPFGQGTYQNGFAQAYAAQGVPHGQQLGTGMGASMGIGVNSGMGMGMGASSMGMGMGTMGQLTPTQTTYAPQSAPLNPFATLQPVAAPTYGFSPQLQMQQLQQQQMQQQQQQQTFEAYGWRQ